MDNKIDATIFKRLFLIAPKTKSDLGFKALVNWLFRVGPDLVALSLLGAEGEVIIDSFFNVPDYLKLPKVIEIIVNKAIGLDLHGEFRIF